MLLSLVPLNTLSSYLLHDKYYLYGYLELQLLLTTTSGKLLDDVMKHDVFYDTELKTLCPYSLRKFYEKK